MSGQPRVPDVRDGYKKEKMGNSGQTFLNIDYIYFIYLFIYKALFSVYKTLLQLPNKRKKNTNDIANSKMKYGFSITSK